MLYRTLYDPVPAVYIYISKHVLFHLYNQFCWCIENWLLELNIFYLLIYCFDDLSDVCSRIYIWHYIVSCQIFIRYKHVIETHSSKGINHSSEIMLQSLKIALPAYVICCSFEGQRSLSLENRHLKVTLMKFKFYFIFSYCLAMLG